MSTIYKSADEWTIVHSKKKSRKIKRRFDTLADCYSGECKEYLGKPHIMKFVKEYMEEIEVMCRYCDSKQMISKKYYFP